jgi:hypothetical protein
MSIFNRSKTFSFQIFNKIASVKKQFIMKEQFYKSSRSNYRRLEAVDGHAKFREDLWERLEGGGRTGYRKWSCFLKRRSKCFCGAW